MITALLIFFALVLEYVYDPISHMKNTTVISITFEKYKTLVKKYIYDKYYIYLVFPIAVIVLYSLITYVIDNYFHSIFTFILDLTVLLYCLKPSEFNRKVEEIKFSQENEVKDISSPRFNYILPNHKGRKFFENIFYNSTRNIFTVLFYFLILGPSGSLAFIILDNYIYNDKMKINQKSKKELKIILSIIEYIPIRLCIFSFAVVANYELCSEAWRTSKKEKNLYDSNIALINTVGMASYEKLEIDSKDADEEKIIFIQSIIYRAFLSWLSLIGFLIIGGIFI
ncbi:MAG: hypothetical protein HOI56_01315 [Gammaproteobacteria bacterium]|jgi:AmpE protein|nr:hypothetical protein [Gammaproteobacteria bacterium]MBT4462897.1 hypothetical protein [Gammaproteobacteria bacterium]MBT4655377.1 hypothetical protein [Gammaproteobacteria bacterium]MBT5761366.1 hypothetical protein [Gammaproteobacteria bacterium]MBT6331932.1 hypothetical protein [Gammaproteobacteria bacterium]